MPISRGGAPKRRRSHEILYNIIQTTGKAGRPRELSDIALKKYFWV
jgi:hypothetical protein